MSNEAENKPVTVAELRSALEELRVAQVRATAPVLTPAEAMTLVGVSSDSALARWCLTWQVKPCGRGRYARHALMRGLEREARAALPRRRTPERAAGKERAAA